MVSIAPTFYVYLMCCDYCLVICVQSFVSAIIGKTVAKERENITVRLAVYKITLEM